MTQQTMLTQLRTLVIIPTLGFLGLDSPSARTLLLGTAAHESQGQYIQQLDGGPALGPFQEEPATEADFLTGYIPGTRFEPLIAQLRIAAPIDGQLAGNWYYACAMARLKYYRDPSPLPPASDLPALAAYWKRVYNTPDGAGTVDEWLNDFATLIGDPPDV